MASEGQTIEIGRAVKSGAAVSLRPMTAASALSIGTAMAAMEPWSRYPISATSLVRFLEQDEPGAPRYEILTDGKSAGTITVRPNWLRGPYVQTFALLPDVQGRGIGGYVMQWVESEARANGDRNLWVATSDFNARALKFYERLGYERLAVIAGLLQDDRDEVLLRKRLI